MIVGWVIFGISVTVAASGLVRTEITLGSMREIGNEVPKPIRSDNVDMVYFYWKMMSDDTSLENGSNEEAIRTLNQFFKQEPISESDDIDVQRATALRNAQTRVRLHDEINANYAEASLLYSKAKIYYGMTLFGTIIAGFLFLWNVIWHTAHWVWMGRKTG